MVEKMTDEQIQAFAEVLRMDVRKKLMDAFMHRLMSGETGEKMVGILPQERLGVIEHHKTSIRELIVGVWNFDDVAAIMAALNIGMNLSFTFNNAAADQFAAPAAAGEINEKLTALAEKPSVVKTSGSAYMDNMGVWHPAPLAKVESQEQIGDGLSADV